MELSCRATRNSRTSTDTTSRETPHASATCTTRSRPSAARRPSIPSGRSSAVPVAAPESHGRANRPAGPPIAVAHCLRARPLEMKCFPSLRSYYLRKRRKDFRKGAQRNQLRSVGTSGRPPEGRACGSTRRAIDAVRRTFCDEAPGQRIRRRAGIARRRPSKRSVRSVAAKRKGQFFVTVRPLTIASVLCAKRMP
jgi:hypothetical protein